MARMRIPLAHSLLICAAVAVAGCSPEAYRRSADAQVYGILARRKKAVLDYQPDTAVQTPSEVTVPKRAYAKIPTTPVPPPTKPPVRTPAPVDVPYGPLGPEKKWLGLPVPEETVQPSSSAAANMDLEGAGSNPY